MSKQKRLRVAVIGTGRIGRLHAEHLAFRIPDAQLVALADVNIQSAREVAERLNVPADRVYEDYRKILNSADIDAVVICSSTDTHSTIIEEAAKAGKQIFCEKPIDNELAKIDRALAAVKKAGVKLQIGFNRRFDPNFRHVYETVQKGGVGDVHILRITSRDPEPPPVDYVSSGMFLDMTIHDFDMARYLSGSEVKRVFAVAGALVDPRFADVGDVDTAVITLEFENGAFGTIDNSRKAVYGYDQRVEVFGTKGVISAENNTPHRAVFGSVDGFSHPLPLNFFMDRYVESYIEELRQFVDCVLRDTEPPVTGHDGRVPVLIAMAASRSLKEGRAVALSEVAEPVLV